MMSKFDEFKEKTGKIITKIMENGKREEENAEVLEHSIKQTGKEKNISSEKIETIVNMLKEQEGRVTELAETIVDNDNKINLVYTQLVEQKSVFKSVEEAIDQQEDIMKNQMEVLKEDNKQCMTQLKDIVTVKGESEEEAICDMIKVNSDEMIKQQRTNTLETGRTLMTMKISIEKDIEELKKSLNEAMEMSYKKNNKIHSIILMMTIINIIVVVGYIVFTLIIK